MSHTPARATNSEELVIGDRIEQQDGPFLATWEVVEIIDAGARLAYCGDVRFVGYGTRVSTWDLKPLTEDPSHSFLGRAHWAAAKRVTD